MIQLNSNNKKKHINKISQISIGSSIEQFCLNFNTVKLSRNKSLWENIFCSKINIVTLIKRVIDLCPVIFTFDWIGQFFST